MESLDIARFVFALLFVVALMGGLYALLKYFNEKGSLNFIKSPSTKRLQLLEILPLDVRHKAVLIRRDNAKDHLVILSQTGETKLVESIDSPPPKSD